MDINPAWMKFDYYQAEGHPSDPTPVPLLPTQQPSPYSYYDRCPPATSPWSTRGDRRQDDGPGPGTRGRRQRSPPPAAVAPVSPARWLRAAVMTTRPRQWPKNLLVFAAPLAGASLGRNNGLGYALIAMLAFGCASAAVYLGQRRRRRRARSAAPGEAEPADRLRRAARTARAGAGRARRDVRRRRRRGDPRAAARYHHLGLPVPVVPLLVPA